MQTKYYPENYVAGRVNMFRITRQAVDAAVCRNVLSRVFNAVQHPINIYSGVYMHAVFDALSRAH